MAELTAENSPSYSSQTSVNLALALVARPITKREVSRSSSYFLV